MRARHGRTVEALADPEARAAHASSQVVLHGRGILGVDVEAEDLEVSVGDPRDRTASRSPPAARRARRRAARGRRRAPRRRGTGGLLPRRAPGGRRCRDTPRGGRRRGPPGVRSSTDRRGSGRRRRPGPRRSSASASESTGRRPSSRLESPGGRPTNVSSYRFVVGSRSSQGASPPPSAGCPTSSSRPPCTRLPVERLAAVGGWKIVASTAFGTTTGSRSSIPSSRCFSSENRDCRIVADAKLGVDPGDAPSVPSSKPR